MALSEPRLLRIGLLLLSVAAESNGVPWATRIEEFLRTAEVVRARPVGKGVTETWRLTLTDGAMTHDASFQSIDVKLPAKAVGRGRTEVHFVDSYRYNIAAYRLALLLDLDDMVPVSVERKWSAKTGAMTWWVDDVAMDENEMLAKGLKPPDPVSWSEQIYRVRLFSQLIQDTDRNRGNLLITSGWRVWMIDFTRAFRIWPRLASPEGLGRCDRDLLLTLRNLTRGDLESVLSDTLTRAEIDGLVARRDLLLGHFDDLIRDRGESAVLY